MTAHAAIGRSGARVYLEAYLRPLAEWLGRPDVTNILRLRLELHF